MLRGRLLLGVLTNRRLWCQQFLGGFHLEGSVFVQPKEGLFSQAATWSTSAFSPVVTEAFLRKRQAGNLTPHAMQGSCCANYHFHPFSGGAWVLTGVPDLLLG
jgi:hypothetical protein